MFIKKFIILILLLIISHLNAQAFVVNTNNLFIEKINELKNFANEKENIKNSKDNQIKQQKKIEEKEYKRCIPFFWKKKKLTDRDKFKARGAIIRKEYKEKGKIITRSEAFKLAQLENKQPITTEEYLVLSKDVPSHQKKVLKGLQASNKYITKYSSVAPVLQDILVSLFEVFMLTTFCSTSYE